MCVFLLFVYNFIRNISFFSILSSMTIVFQHDGILLN